ncbi:hypothetical protein ACFLTE_11280 [Bacteroidota bacterium]
MKQNVLLLLAFLLLCLQNRASDYPIRLGVKLGTPNLAGLSGEYLLPFGWDRFALSVDYSYLPLKFFNDHVQSKYRYLSGDIKIYPFNKGYKGFFIGAGLSKAKHSIMFDELIPVVSGIDWVKFSLKWDYINFGMDIDFKQYLYKIGYRYMHNRFTLLLEVMYVQLPYYNISPYIDIPLIGEARINFGNFWNPSTYGGDITLGIAF